MVKTKRFLALLLTICMAISLAPSIAFARDPFTGLNTDETAVTDASGWRYSAVSGTITGFDATKTGGTAPENIVIPTQLGGVNIVAIADNVFFGNVAIESVTIGSHITKLGEGAFTNCSNLTTLTYAAAGTLGDGSEYQFDSNGALYSDFGATLIYVPYVKRVGDYGTVPSSVTRIGNNVFNSAKELTIIDLGNEISSLGNSVFYDCSKLTTVRLGVNVTEIGSGTFQNCVVLTSDFNFPRLTKIDANAFRGCKQIKNINVGIGITSIGANAFYDCNLLESAFYLPNLTRLEAGTFWTCSKIKTIEIGSGVTFIGNSAFKNCTELTSDFYLPNLTEIENEGFRGSNKIKNIDVGSGLVSIGNYAFNATALESDFNLPNVETIGVSAFFACNKITTINVGSRLRTIGNDAFRGCNVLTSEFNLPNVETIGGNAFTNCSIIPTIRIGDKLTSVNTNSFVNCVNLKEFYIGNNAITEFPMFFNNNAIIKKIAIGKNVSTFPDNAFNNLLNLEEIWFLSDSSNEIDLSNVGDLNEKLNRTTVLKVYCAKGTTVDEYFKNSGGVTNGKVELIYYNTDDVTDTDAAIPQIMANNMNRAVLVGETVTLDVTSTSIDGGEISYQWYKNSTNSTDSATLISGATSATYTINNVQTSDAGYYFAEITNTIETEGTTTAKINSKIAQLTVTEIVVLVNAQEPVINTQPSGYNLIKGIAATPLIVSATSQDGGTPLYSWYKNSVNSTTGGTPVGLNATSYTPDVSAVGTNYYYAVVTNFNNKLNGVQTATTTSNVVAVTVEGATLSGIAITTEPTKTTYKVGEAIDLTGLVVTGTYSDGSSQAEAVTTANISGFDSSVVAGSQLVTVTVGGQTATFTVAIELSAQQQATKDLEEALAEGITEANIDEVLANLELAGELTLSAEDKAYLSDKAALVAALSEVTTIAGLVSGITEYIQDIKDEEAANEAIANLIAEFTNPSLTAAGLETILSDTGKLAILELDTDVLDLIKTDYEGLLGKIKELETPVTLGDIKNAMNEFAEEVEEKQADKALEDEFKSITSEEELEDLLNDPDKKERLELDDEDKDLLLDNLDKLLEKIEDLEEPFDLDDIKDAINDLISDIKEEQQAKADLETLLAGGITMANIDEILAKLELSGELILSAEDKAYLSDKAALVAALSGVTTIAGLISGITEYIQDIKDEEAANEAIADLIAEFTNPSLTAAELETILSDAGKLAILELDTDVLDLIKTDYEGLLGKLKALETPATLGAIKGAMNEFAEEIENAQADKALEDEFKSITSEEELEALLNDPDNKDRLGLSDEDKDLLLDNLDKLLEKIKDLEEPFDLDDIKDAIDDLISDIKEEQKAIADLESALSSGITEANIDDVLANLEKAGLLTISAEDKAYLTDKAALVAALSGVTTIAGLISGIEDYIQNEKTPPIVNAEAPVFTKQPIGSTVETDSVVTLTVAATVADGGAVTYKWFNDSDAEVGTGASLVVPTSVNGTFTYYVMATNENTAVNGVTTASTKSNVVTVRVMEEVDNAGFGDVDGDGKVTMNDFAIASKAYQGLASAEAEMVHSENAKSEGNTKTTIADLLAILAKAALQALSN